MQREEKPEPTRMILSGHDSVLRSSCGPADFLAACEQLGLLQCNSHTRRYPWFREELDAVSPERPSPALAADGCRMDWLVLRSLKYFM
jgi:hypothetical protein